MSDPVEEFRRRQRYDRRMDAALAIVSFVLYLSLVAYVTQGWLW